MLQFIHRNRRSLGFLFMLAVMCLMMSGFGLNYLARGVSGSRTSAAIQIGDREIQFNEVEHNRRQLQDQYQRMFGPQYYTFLEKSGIDLNQQVIDKTITDAVIEEEARKLGFAAGKEELVDFLHTGLFPGGFNREEYNLFLAQRGQSAAQFEAEMRDELMRAQYVNLLRDASMSSRKEALDALIQERTEYAVRYVILEPNRFKNEVPAPSDEELAAFYDRNSTDYETPARVAYDYVLFDPEKFHSTVEVQPDDIEAYYSENQGRFTLPEEAHVRVIHMGVPKDADDDALKKRREEAEQVLEKARAGDPFEALVEKHSDDAAAKPKGGDLGWVKRGERSTAFDAAVFSHKEPAIADLITNPDGFEIVKIEQYKPSEVRPLNDVRAEITEEIQKREAPAFVADRAHAVFEKWKNSGEPLAEVAKRENVPAASTNGVLSAKDDPAPEVKGLTAVVLNFPEEKRQVADLGEKTVLIEIRDFKPSELPKLSDVREKVLESYRTLKAKDLARERAEDLRANLGGAKFRDLASAAKVLGVEEKTESGLSRQKAGSGLGSHDGFRRAVFSRSAEGVVLPEVINYQDSFVVAQVQSIKRPTPESVAKDVEAYRAQESQKLGQILVTSLLNTLKSQMTIDVNPSLMAGGGGNEMPPEPLPDFDFGY